MSLRFRKRKIERRIDSLFKKEITRKDLIDTGALRKSFKSAIVKRNRILQIDIEMMYYFQYLDEPFSLSKDIYESIDFKLINLDIAELISDELFRPLPKMFKSSSSVNYSFKFQ